MSNLSKAVFLSYASQDAEAAKRIAEALRGAGVEVWFDQNELVGGDAWDAKIRGQIGSCALFVPVISANTQARLEGYFRLEWKIAAQRTHTMADERVFLLPVVIDATRDAEARVPAEFKSVQWTRLPGGEATPAFCARVRKLLEAEGVAEISPGGPAPAAPVARPASERRFAWLRYGWVALGLLVALVFAVRPMFQDPRSREAKPALEPGPVPEARRITQQARELITKTGRGSSKWEAAALLCERALALDPTDAEAHALASQVDSRLWFHVFDRTPKRSESARRRAARALDLAPASFEARLAQATFLVLVAGRPQSEQAESVLRQLRLEAPTDPRPPNLLGSLFMALQRNEESLAFNDEEARIPGNEAYGLMQKAWNLHRLRRLPEMETALDRSVELQPLAGSVTLRVYYDLGWWGDRDRALASLNRLPAEELAEDNGVSAAVRVHRWRRDPEALLRFLGTVPRDWLWWGVRGPKAALTGDAHASAGRMLAARTDWQTALALVERHLVEAPNDQNLLEWKAYLHARLGDTSAAREAYQRSLESVPIERGLLEIEKLGYIAPEEEVLGELERRAESAVADLEAKQRMSARFISAADLRLNPAWDPVRSLPRFQTLLARLEADPRFNPNLNPPVSSAAKIGDKSVAVLAFANLSDDKANEYFSDGISEELLNVLAKVPGLKVSARTSAFFFKGRNTPIPEIAKQLGVAYVVEGSVRKAGDKVRITAQLIKTADGFHVWSDTFTRDLKDIFAVQDEIAGLIAQQLQLKLGSSAAVRPVDPEAHRLLLEGRHYWGLRTLDGFDRAEAAFRRASEIDPELAPAHAGMAVVMATRVAYLAYVGERFPSLEPIRVTARRALAIDPTLPEAQAALAFALVIEGAAAESEREYQKALAMHPNSALLHHWSALTLEIQGRLDEALAEITRATELDPLSGTGLITRQRMAIFARRYNEALEMFERAEGLLPERESVLASQAICLLQLGRAAEAAAVARSVSASSSLNRRIIADAQVVHVLRATGHTAEAEAHAAAIMPRLLPDSYQRGAILAALGRWDEAEPFLAQTPTTLRYLYLWDPLWDAWREDPRFHRLIKRLDYVAEYHVARATLARMQKEAGSRK